jgi:hypothetical protein
MGAAGSGTSFDPAEFRMLQGQQNGSFHGLKAGDKTFLDRLSRSIREQSTGFELGGKFIDTRFSLPSMRRNGQVALPIDPPLHSPQQRLIGALRWAAQPTSGTDEEELQAICILAWLGYDETAHTLEKVLCELQLIPWKPVLGEVDGGSRGALALWGSREAVARQTFDSRLVEAARRSAAELELQRRLRAACSRTSTDRPRTSPGSSGSKNRSRVP